MTWVLTNKKLKMDLPLAYTRQGTQLFSDQLLVKKENIQILLEGYIIPRDPIYSEYQNYRSDDLIVKLYKKYGSEFTRYIKGVFLIIIIDIDQINIFSDRFGIKKFFYSNNSDTFILSNKLDHITRHAGSQLSPVNNAIHALLCHHVGGRTMFKDIHYSNCACRLEIKNNTVKHGQYWDISELYGLEESHTSYHDFADYFVHLLDHTLQFSGNKSLTLSLTGGNDSRLILGSLLKLGHNPHLYTYGDPESYDGVVPRKIAAALKLNHIIHEINFTEDAFSKKADQIINDGNSLTSIHRAHRLAAIEKESTYADSMILGSLGGEFIKGATVNDYIIANFIRDWWYSSESKHPGLLKEALERKFINTENLDFDEVYHTVSQEPYLQNKDLDLNELNALCFITARLHDAQDLNLYHAHFNEVIPFFLDIDYLSYLFKSPFHFIRKNQIKNPNLRKIENPLFSANMLRHIAPDLMDIEYASYYTPNEVLQSKYLTAAKKIFRSRKTKYPPNFPLTGWMVDFVSHRIESLSDNEFISNHYQLSKANAAFKSGNHKTNEAYWLKYTNMIMYKMLIEYY